MRCRLRRNRGFGRHKLAGIIGVRDRPAQERAEIPPIVAALDIHHQQIIGTAAEILADFGVVPAKAREENLRIKSARP